MKFKYSIQCDKLRSLPNGEESWQYMMLRSRLIDLDVLAEKCDFSTLFDEDESYYEFVASDERSGCYETEWDGGIAYFIQTSGFEFFFTEDGKYPLSACKPEPIIADTQRSLDARLLLPENSALAYIAFGEERQVEWIDGDTRVLVGGHGHRIIQLVDEIPMAAIMVEGGRIVSRYFSAYIGSGILDSLIKKSSGYVGVEKNEEESCDFSI